jgi:hypothetical protein
MNDRAWSAADLQQLAALYPSKKTAAVAAALGRSVSAVYRTAHKQGLSKSAEFLASDESGQLHKGQSRPGSEVNRFVKGHTPANAGLRRPGWHAGRMKETQFKPGERTGAASRNWRPIGTILIDHEGYRRIKVREAKPSEATGFGNTKVWPLLNRHLWEQAHGPIPPKHLVAFKDGDRANCVLANLELRSMADNARRNVMWNRYPRELAETIQLAGVLKRKLRSENGAE